MMMIVAHQAGHRLDWTVHSKKSVVAHSCKQYLCKAMHRRIGTIECLVHMVAWSDPTLRDEIPVRFELLGLGGRRRQAMGALK